VKRRREGDDRDDRRRRKIRPERERGCGRRFQRRRRTSVKQSRQGDYPRPTVRRRFHKERVGGGAVLEGLKPILKQNKMKNEKQNKNSRLRQLVVSLL